MSQTVLQLAYLAAAVLFILGLRNLSSPRTAPSGNLLAAAGMLLAVVATLVSQGIIGWPVILAGVVLGSAIGAALALRIQMTAMPQMVALLNGFGGAASALVAGAELLSHAREGTQPTGIVPTAIVLATITQSAIAPAASTAFTKRWSG